ncbi:MAG TPA: glycosyltransferase family 4 protein [Pseudomonadales bacterium]|nr:glycosyltransferase family 4 protein [Pseudomonadales bacterium]
MRIAILTSDNRERFKDYHHPTPYFGPAPEALLQGFAALGKEVEVHVVSCLQETAPAPEKIAGNMWYHAVRVPKMGWMRTLYQGCIRAVRKKLHEIQPDIVHGQGTERECSMCAIYSGFPNVLTIHGNMLTVARHLGGAYWGISARLETFALKRTIGVFCNSAYTESLVTPRTKRTWRVPNALRQAFFEQPPKEGRDPLPGRSAAEAGAGPAVLNIGEIVSYKRQREILEVARKLHQRGLRFEMQFIGGMESRDDYLRNFQSEIAEAQKAGYARHLGKMDLKQLIDTMDAASALIHFPSEEAFGLVAAEALARNLKLFASSLGGVADIATGTEGAEVIPGDDWAGLENNVAKWLEAGCPRPMTAAKTMHERYAPEVVARQHLEIYRSLG